MSNSVRDFKYRVSLLCVCMGFIFVFLNQWWAVTFCWLIVFFCILSVLIPRLRVLTAESAKRKDSYSSLYNAKDKGRCPTKVLTRCPFSGCGRQTFCDCNNVCLARGERKSRARGLVVDGASH